MIHEHRLRFKTTFMVLLMVACASAGDLLLKHGMSQMGAVHLTLPGLWHAFLSTLQNPTIWLGILFLIGYTLSYMTAVSWADYSYVMPAGAFGYALQTILAVLILREVVVAKRWVGVVLIVLGVSLVGQTRPSTTASATQATP
jgi:uncharacterized membrane protein